MILKLIKLTFFYGVIYFYFWKVKTDKNLIK
jgi:cbb3-type cytochrome oxidase subunit 3